MQTTTHFDGSQPYAVETLVTDTVAYDVVSFTAQTITVRRRRSTVAVHSSGASYPVVTSATESNPDAPTKRLRLRKDGTYRTSNWSHPLRFTTEEPTTRIDYSF